MSQFNNQNQNRSSGNGQQAQNNGNGGNRKNRFRNNRKKNRFSSGNSVQNNEKQGSGARPAVQNTNQSGSSNSSAFGNPRFQKQGNKGGFPFQKKPAVSPNLPVFDETENLNLPQVDCPYCGKPIKFLNTAISVDGEENPVHFDCILTKIGETEQIASDESISYLGGGFFGIIRTIKESPGFTIRKKFKIEEIAEKPEWRKKMSSRLKGDF